MGLGQRTAKHDTVGSRHDAVRSEDYADFAVRQHVRTLDGLLGVVTAVNDGPVPGYEDYEVTLDNDMGVGTYMSSQLTAVGDTTASEQHTADCDYPEMGTILIDRPDPSRHQGSMGSGTPFAFSHQEHDTGGTKHPTRVDVTVHHPETGEPVGTARYFPPKRRGGPITLDEIRTDHPGAGSALLNEIESRHPGSVTKFPYAVKKNNNNPDVTGHGAGNAGNPSDWDTHYPNLAPTIHRGLTVRMTPRDAQTVNSTAPVEDHLPLLHEMLPEGRSLGMHWTENEHAARQFAHNAVSDYRTDIPVVLHARTPDRKNIETRQDHLYRGGVFPYGDAHSPENEVPVRRGRQVQVTGISWRPDAAHPDADENGWVHHSYAEPQQHKATRTR
jgi:hypothetical protein